MTTVGCPLDHDGRVAILMSSLRGDGKVESSLEMRDKSLAEPLMFAQAKPDDVDGQETTPLAPSVLGRFLRRSLDRLTSCCPDTSQEFASQSEAKAFKFHQQSLRSHPFKRAILLLALNSLSVILIYLTFELLLIGNQSQVLRSQNFQFQATTVIVLASSLIQLLLLAYVMFTLFWNHKGQHESQLGDLQLLVLISSSIFATILTIRSRQLFILMPTTMFIIYTLLAVDSQRAFIATFAANSIHLLSFPLNLLDEQTVQGSDRIGLASGMSSVLGQVSDSGPIGLGEKGGTESNIYSDLTVRISW